jgi:hypothetical protein
MVSKETQPSKAESKAEPMDYIMWVGGGAYSRDSFEEEAKQMGACRRIRFIPNNLVVGKSRIFLVSDMSREDKKEYEEEVKRRDRNRYHMWIEKVREDAVEHNLIEDGVEISYKEAKELHMELREKFDVWSRVSITKPLPRGEPVVFAFFIVRGISYIVGPGVDLDEELKKRGVTEYEYHEGEFGFNDERGCGSLKIGGTYLLSEEDMEKVKDLAESGKTEGSIVILDKEIPYKGKRSRAMKAIPQAMGNRLISMGITVLEEES